jgi:hypothetical protein
MFIDHAFVPEVERSGASALDDEDFDYDLEEGF